MSISRLLLLPILLVLSAGVGLGQIDPDDGASGEHDFGLQSAGSWGITQEILVDVNVDAVGLIPSRVSGLPNNLWKDSKTDELVDKVARLSTDLVPEALELLYVLLLAEANPPKDSIGDGKLFLARIDKLIEFGALDHANVLMGRGGRSAKSFFDRRFAIALLTQTARTPCSEISADHSTSADYSQRIYCLVRLGDWKTANIVFEISRMLGEFSPLEEQIISIYLFPELAFSMAGIEFEELSPLSFRMLKDSGYSYSFQNDNNTFGYYLKDSNAPWQTRLAVHESLTKSLALPFETLLVAYAEGVPPASGGVWDRVMAIQALESALQFDRTEEIKNLFMEAYTHMNHAGLSVSFSKYFVPRVFNHLMEFGKIASDFFVPVIISELSPNQRNLLAPMTREESFYVALKFGQFESAIPGTALQESILAGLTATSVEGPLGDLVSQGRIGEALLEVFGTLQNANQTPPGEIRSSLAALTVLGLQVQAREIALQIMVIENEKYLLR